MCRYSILYPIVTLTVLLLPCQSASAFMTYWWFGGAIHKGILRDALSPLGVSRKSLKMIARGTDSQDSPFKRNFASPVHHATANQIKSACQYFTERTEKAVEAAEQADKSPRQRQLALYALGEGMHTLQDFYSHSNYLEWLLANRLPLEPVNWQDIPGEVRTCYYQYDGFFDQEPFHTHATNIRKLKVRYPDASFRAEEEYARRKNDCSLKASLKYALLPGDLLHREINKDNASQLEGRVIVPEYGKNLFELAKEMARLDTQRQWMKFESMIRERYSGRADSIVKALKGTPPSGIDIISGDHGESSAARSEPIKTGL